MRDERVAGLRLIVHPWISILTTPARPDYLQATVDQVDDLTADALEHVLRPDASPWYGTKLIAVDGDHMAVPRRAGWERGPVGYQSQPSGTTHAMLSILREAAIDGAPFLLYFEDDIVLSRNAIEYMSCVEVPSDCAFLAFCDIGQQANALSTTDGLVFRSSPSETRPHWGNQALKIPLRTLERVRAMGKPRDWPHRDQSDVLLGRLAVTEDAPFIGHVTPSIVDHVGALSVVHPDKGIEGYGRRPHNFAGVDFDAMSLEVRE